MPFKSKAQRRKFAELLVKGEITPETFEEWNRETGGKELPERVEPQPATKRRKKPKKATATKKSAKKKVARAAKRTHPKGRTPTKKK